MFSWTSCLILLVKRARLFAIQHARFVEWESRDRLTTLFIHVETCRNMLYVIFVEGSLIRIKMLHQMLCNNTFLLFL